MGNILLQFIPLAFAAISPVLILAVSMLLGVKNGLSKALAFTVGKYLIYVGWGIVFISLSERIVLAGGNEPPTAMGAVQSLLGVLLLVLAGKSLLGEDDPDAPPPKWMSALETASARVLFGIGALLSLIQLRFVLLMAAGVSIMMTAKLSSGQTVVLLLVLALCMVWPLIVPIVIYLLMGERSAQVLASMNQWLTVNQRWVNFVILFLFGLLMLINGLATLHVIGG